MYVQYSRVELSRSKTAMYASRPPLASMSKAPSVTGILKEDVKPVTANRRPSVLRSIEWILSLPVLPKSVL